MCKVPGIETQRMSGSQPHEKKKGGESQGRDQLMQREKGGE